jgi:antitoxin component HigA of HigAB toxin-antitoxin module
MKTTKPKLRFADLPGDYAALCRVFLPRPIRDKTDYGNTIEVVEAMVLHHEEFTRDQEDYFDHLFTLVERYEKATVKWPKSSGLDLLKFLLEQNDMSGADLSRLLGVSAKLGPMILRGERSITAEHARILGKRFAMNPGAFIE